MVSGCILVCCKPGLYSDVAKDIQGLKGVVVAFSASGRWDVITEIEVADMKALSDLMLKINGLPGVRATETLVEVSL
jgi:DNA-binding Lrp family transcriptional regulator